MAKNTQAQRDAEIEKRHQEIVKLLAEKNPKNNARLDDLLEEIRAIMHPERA